MTRTAFHSLWNEPRVPDAPARVWRDWVLLAVVAVAVVIEGSFREPLDWRIPSIIICLAPAYVLLQRRTQPLRSLLIGFGTVSVANVGTLVGLTDTIHLYSFAYIIVLSYTAARWGSGREVVIGTVVVQLANVLSEITHYSGIGSLLGAAAFALFPPVIGLSVRFWLRSQVSETAQLRLREREQLARELHDTVAHHVSAIAVQAQAGQAVAAINPEAAVDVLAVIEDAASRALEDMRAMVGTLRDGEDPELAPQRGVSDIETLANNPNAALPVVVELSGDLDDLKPAVGAALYRLAQESITNATRHATGASRVDVAVIGDEESVRLSVRDDGATSGGAHGSAGFGLVGMTERAKLLGGSFAAGPNPGRGWTVTASLPKTGANS